MAKTVGVTSSADSPAINTPGGEAGTGDAPTILSHDEQVSLAGDFAKEGTGDTGGVVPLGTTGFVDLDAEGHPTGTVHKEQVPGRPQAAVANIQTVEPDVLCTPSGAPLTTHMNPNPDHFDAGMAARNPPPKETKVSAKATSTAPKPAEPVKA